MNKEIKELEPKLRFPEFLDIWNSKRLGQLGKFIGGGTPNKAITEYWQGDIPWISSSDISDDDIHHISITRYINEKAISESATKIIPKGSVLFISRVGTGKLAINDKDVCTSQDFTNFIPDKIHNYFLSYFFLANKSALTALDQGTSIKGFSKSDLEKIELSFPCEKEQTKIAACLSSLDDLITAQTQKIAALKTHKKGLMQQLFPQEGETVPKLRFPEFSSEWATNTIQSFLDNKFIVGHLDGNHGALYPKSEDFSKNGIPYVTANDFINGEVEFNKCKFLSYEKAKLFKKGIAKNGDVLFAHNATVGPCAILKTELDYVVLSTTATYYRCDLNKLNNYFLFHYLQSTNFVSQYSSIMSQSTRNQVPITTQRKLFLTLPTLPEQQKIADCLSSLDELINAQVKKCDALKLHKKGLMQGLFPVSV